MADTSKSQAVLFPNAATGAAFALAAGLFVGASIVLIDMLGEGVYAAYAAGIALICM